MTDLITVGLDGTLQSLSAALWAAREAELRKVRLRLLHAWIQLGPEPAGAPSEEAEEHYWPHRITDEAQASVASSHPDLPVDVRLVRGDPFDALAQRLKSRTCWFSAREVWAPPRASPWERSVWNW
ncbi:universal stress protein [Streptomyces platensis]|uniref:universal stress protein n=1 Tax=Streptomyces platensis TaxID=58346 RepID=UPI002E14F20C|nr:universal stress protein [Streptomyces platensis]